MIPGSYPRIPDTSLPPIRDGEKLEILGRTTNTYAIVDATKKEPLHLFTWTSNLPQREVDGKRHPAEQIGRILLTVCANYKDMSSQTNSLTVLTRNIMVKG